MPNINSFFLNTVRLGGIYFCQSAYFPLTDRPFHHKIKSVPFFKGDLLL